MKLFEYILIDMMGDKLKASDRQFAYKNNHSATLGTFMISQVVQYYVSKKSNVFLLFLDASKAFDRIDHRKLYETMVGKTISPSIIRMIMAMYSLDKPVVKWGSNISKSFSCPMG